MAEQARPPVGIMILAVLHVIAGSFAGLAVLAKLVRGVADGIPLMLLVWISRPTPAAAHARSTFLVPRTFTSKTLRRSAAR